VGLLKEVGKASTIALTTPTTTKRAKDEMMDINEKKQTTPWVVPRLKIGSNDT
jgi:hypothetical protein